MKPADILAESFRIIEAEVGAHRFDAQDWPIVRRMIHASGDVDLVHAVRFHGDPVPAAMKALARKTPIVTDVTMVLAGIQQAAAKELGVPLHCFLNDPAAEERVKASGFTRSAAGIEQAIAEVPDAIFAIGNAPTALLSLCAAVRAGRAGPALILAMPVGFVAVAESKEEALRLNVPVIAVAGRKGGSAVTAAAVNALLQLALGEQSSLTLPARKAEDTP
jgi:precorrin-8X/cobalt-precorrin-8 methylmutase